MATKLLLALAFLIGSLEAQRTTEVEATRPAAGMQRPQVVPLHLVALDSRGAPLDDLTEDELQLQDQGQSQRILMFRHNAGRALTARPLQPDESSNQLAGRPGHATVVLLDLLNANLSARGSGWEGVNRALEQVASAENVYLYLLTPDARIYPVRGVPDGEQPETSPGLWTRGVRKRLDTAIATVHKLKPADERDPDNRFQSTFSALAVLSTQVERLPAVHKNIVWISYGVPIYIRQPSSELLDMTEFVRKFSARLNRAGISMYSVDQGSGATAGPNNGYQGRDTLELLANFTGGRSYPSNSVELAVPAAIASERGSYLLLYDPGPPNWDGKFHKVRISCTRKGARIQAPEGYYAMRRDPELERLQAAFEAVAKESSDAAGIGIRSKVAAPASDARTLRIDVRVEPADLWLTRQGSRDEAQLAIGFAALLNGGVVSLSSAFADVSLSQAQRVDAMKNGLPFVHNHTTTPGVDKIRVIVMDLRSGAVGSLTLAVPSAPAGP